MHKKIPIKAVGIEILPAYYLHYLKEKYPDDYLNPYDAFCSIDETLHFPEMLLLLNQVAEYRGTGISAKLFQKKCWDSPRRIPENYELEGRFSHEIQRIRHISTDTVVTRWGLPQNEKIILRQPHLLDVPGNSLFSFTYKTFIGTVLFHQLLMLSLLNNYSSIYHKDLICIAYCF